MSTAVPCTRTDCPAPNPETLADGTPWYCHQCKGRFTWRGDSVQTSRRSRINRQTIARLWFLVAVIGMFVALSGIVPALHRNFALSQDLGLSGAALAVAGVLLAARYLYAR